ncbi:hypothetical protein RRG08_008380 [Elysia crispata]|uniref:Secreted protein n=1 Tax=Elysia crispata TaxID=231223 RepID=A0AAE1B0D8_9GAST|nr:hypothetical protein RRG08_008380 [Elysia crispata]
MKLRAFLLCHYLSPQAWARLAATSRDGLHKVALPLLNTCLKLLSTSTGAAQHSSSREASTSCPTAQRELNLAYPQIVFPVHNLRPVLPNCSELSMKGTGKSLTAHFGISPRTAVYFMSSIFGCYSERLRVFNKLASLPVKLHLKSGQGSRECQTIANSSKSSRVEPHRARAYNYLIRPGKATVPLGHAGSRARARPIDSLVGRTGGRQNAEEAEEMA